MLTMPYCVEATPEVYDFYAAKGCIMDPGSPREMWDGSAGVIIYGRSTEKNTKHQAQPPEKWTVCLGKHKPFMPAEKWLAVQSQFTQNKCIKDAMWPVPLLKGVLRCKCGNLMQVSRKKKVDGTCSSWYYCRKRMRQGVDACDMGQIKCDLLDEEVLGLFRGITADPALIQKFVKAEAPADVPDLKAAQARVSACERKIGRLAASLALAEDSAASKYIIVEMERLDVELGALKREASLAEMESHRAAASAKDAKATAAEIAKLIHGLDGFDDKEKNAIARAVIQECTWDGERLFITL